MFKDKLQQLVHERNTTPEHLCATCNLTLASYHLWITGQRVPYLPNLKTIANYFKISVDELLDGTVPTRGRANECIEFADKEIDPDAPVSSIGDKLRVLCYFRGIELSDVYHECSISMALLKSVLRETVASTEPYQVLADYFGVPVWALLCDEPVDMGSLSVKACSRYNVRNIGKSLRCLRIMQGLPVSGSAQLLKVSQISLKNYEIGKTICPAVVFRDACEIYDISAKDMTSVMCLSDEFHSWFASASPYTRLIYLKTVRDLKLGDISVSLGLPQNALVNIYKQDKITEVIGRRVASYFNVPLDWVYGNNPEIEQNIEIR